MHTHTAATTTTPLEEDERYEDFLVSLRADFAAATADQRHLFTTDAGRLFDLFLENLPPERRQHYTCNACRSFVNRYGSLVVISESGRTTPALWDAHQQRAPFFAAAVRACARAVARARVTGVFLSSAAEWGNPVTFDAAKAPGEWHHMSVAPAAELLAAPSATLTLFQRMAAKVQDFRTVSRALGEFSPATVEQARALLAAGKVDRSEKMLPGAEWFASIHAARDAAKTVDQRENVTWRAVAGAPDGFCHVRAGVLGKLLEGLAAGKPVEAIRRELAAMMDPLQYQRPQAAPSAGAIKEAERIVEKLRAEGSLQRRFLRPDEVEALWKPKPTDTPASGGVFAHLKAKAPVALQVASPIEITFAKFLATVLPSAEAIEFFVPATSASYGALVTAVNPAAPPILQWDDPEKRNPVSWYFYSHGSPPERWNLQPNVWHPVSAVCLMPHQWGGRDLPHHAKGAFFLLEGARDVHYERGALFFPETLRGEFHAVRSVMEAHALASTIAGAKEPMAAGAAVQAGRAWNQRVRVTSKGVALVYQIDRWD